MRHRGGGALPALSAATMVAGMALAGAALAGGYPEKPVTITIGYAAGGTVDIATRILAEDLTARLGQRFLVDNKPGASGMIAADAVAEAAPDGATIGMITTSQLGTNPHLFSKIAYKAEDFAPIGIAVRAPIALAVAPDLPVTTIAEFQAYAKAHGAEMTYGSFGLGTNAQLVTEAMNSALGIEMQHAPYAQGAMARTDLSAGTIQALVDSIAAIAPLHDSGQVRVIGSFYDAPSARLPGVATFAEYGFPDLVAFTWLGFVAPAGTPPEVVETLNGAVRAALAEPAVAKRLEEAGFILAPSSPEEMAATIRADYDRWGPLIARLGIRLD